MKKILILFLTGLCSILYSQNFNTWTCEENPLNKNLIGYYTFNGNVNDFSISGNNFTHPFTSADYSPDRIGGILNGNSLNIKDLSEGVSPTSDFDGINGLSVSLRLKLNSISQFDKIVSLSNGGDELAVVLKKEKLAFDALKLNRSQSKISNMSKGLYLVKICDQAGGFLVRKLVVE